MKVIAASSILASEEKCTNDGADHTWRTKQSLVEDALTLGVSFLGFYVLINVAVEVKKCFVRKHELSVNVLC